MPPEALRMDAGWLGMSPAEVLRGHHIRGSLGQMIPPPDAGAFFFDRSCFAGHFQQLMSALYSMDIRAANESPCLTSAVPYPSNPGDPQLSTLSGQDRPAASGPIPRPSLRVLSWRSSRPASPSVLSTVRQELSSPAGYSRILRWDASDLEAPSSSQESSGQGRPPPADDARAGLASCSPTRRCVQQHV